MNRKTYKMTFEGLEQSELQTVKLPVTCPFLQFTLLPHSEQYTLYTSPEFMISSSGVNTFSTKSEFSPVDSSVQAQVRRPSWEGQVANP